MPSLHDIFFLVCRSSNVWTVGGVALPFCQRCTGLYVGAILAVIAVAVFRPRPTSRTVWLHGWMLILMAPFGFHWVTHNGVIRTLTGALFAFGLVYFLLLNPIATFGFRIGMRSGVMGRYLLVMLAGLTLLLVAVLYGGRGAGLIIPWMGFAGLLVYAVAVAANLLAFPLTLWRAPKPAIGMNI